MATTSASTSAAEGKPWRYYYVLAFPLRTPPENLSGILQTADAIEKREEEYLTHKTDSVAWATQLSPWASSLSSPLPDAFSFILQRSAMCIALVGGLVLLPTIYRVQITSTGEELRPSVFQATYLVVAIVVAVNAALWLAVHRRASSLVWLRLVALLLILQVVGAACALDQLDAIVISQRALLAALSQARAAFTGEHVQVVLNGGDAPSLWRRFFADGPVWFLLWLEAHCFTPSHSATPTTDAASSLSGDGIATNTLLVDEHDFFMPLWDTRRAAQCARQCLTTNLLVERVTCGVLIAFVVVALIQLLCTLALLTVSSSHSTPTDGTLIPKKRHGHGKKAAGTASWTHGLSRLATLLLALVGLALSVISITLLTSCAFTGAVETWAMALVAVFGGLQVLTALTIASHGTGKLRTVPVILVAMLALEAYVTVLLMDFHASLLPDSNREHHGVTTTRPIDPDILRGIFEKVFAQHCQPMRQWRAHVCVARPRRGPHGPRVAGFEASTTCRDELATLLGTTTEHALQALTWLMVAQSVILLAIWLPRLRALAWDAVSLLCGPSSPSFSPSGFPWKCCCHDNKSRYMDKDTTKDMRADIAMNKARCPTSNPQDSATKERCAPPSWLPCNVSCCCWRHDINGYDQGEEERGVMLEEEPLITLAHARDLYLTTLPDDQGATTREMAAVTFLREWSKHMDDQRSTVSEHTDKDQERDGEAEKLSLSQFESILRSLVLARLTERCKLDVSITVARDGRQLLVRVAASDRLLLATLVQQQEYPSGTSHPSSTPSSPSSASSPSSTSRSSSPSSPFPLIAAGPLHKVSLELACAVEPGARYWKTHTRELRVDNTILDDATIRYRFQRLVAQRVLSAQEAHRQPGESQARVSARIHALSRLARREQAQLNASSQKIDDHEQDKGPPVFARYVPLGYMQYLYRKYPNRVDAVVASQDMTTTTTATAPLMATKPPMPITTVAIKSTRLRRAAVLRTADALRLTRHLLDSEFHLERMQEHGLLVGVMPLHSASRMDEALGSRDALCWSWVTFWKPVHLPGEPMPPQHLGGKWLTSQLRRISPVRQPLRGVRDYFGERVAFFFAGLAYNAQWLALPTIGLLLLWILQPELLHDAVWADWRPFFAGDEGNSDDDDAMSHVFHLTPSVLVLMGGMLLWGVHFAAQWQSRSAWLRLEWGMNENEDNEHERERESEGGTTAVATPQITIIRQFASAVLLLVVGLGHNLLCVALVLLQGIMAAPSVIGDYRIAMLLSLLLVVSLMHGMRAIIPRLCLILRQLECPGIPMLMSTCQYNMRIKCLALHVFITLIPPLLLLVLASASTRGGALHELISTALGVRVCSASLCRLVRDMVVVFQNHVMRNVSAVLQLQGLLLLWFTTRLVAHAVSFVQMLLLHYYQLQQQRRQRRQWTLSLEAEMALAASSATNAVDDMAVDTITASGVVLLFTGVCPLLPLLALMDGLLMLRLHALQYCVSMRRPAPARADGHEPWGSGSSLLLRLGILCNAALVYLVTDNCGHWGMARRVSAFLGSVGVGVLVVELLLCVEMPWEGRWGEHARTIVRKRHAFVRKRYFGSEGDASMDAKNGINCTTNDGGEDGKRTARLLEEIQDDGLSEAKAVLARYVGRRRLLPLLIDTHHRRIAKEARRKKREELKRRKTERMEDTSSDGKETGETTAEKQERKAREVKEMDDAMKTVQAKRIARGSMLMGMQVVSTDHAEATRKKRTGIHRSKADAVPSEKDNAEKNVEGPFVAYRQAKRVPTESSAPLMDWGTPTASTVEEGPLVNDEQEAQEEKEASTATTPIASDLEEKSAVPPPPPPPPLVHSPPGSRTFMARYTSRPAPSYPRTSLTGMSAISTATERREFAFTPQQEHFEHDHQAPTRRERASQLWDTVHRRRSSSSVPLPPQPDPDASSPRHVALSGLAAVEEASRRDGFDFSPKLLTSFGLLFFTL